MFVNHPEKRRGTAEVGGGSGDGGGGSTLGL